MSALTSFVQDRVRITQRERQLVAMLNRLLPSLGYRVVPNGGSRDTGARLSARSSAQKSLVCEVCDRRFAHPLHLGRHMAATHRAKAERRAKERRKPRASARSRNRNKTVNKAA
jgi:hypothetical protein